MKPLDPRLLRYATGPTRRYLAACVGLGVASALLILAQAALLGYAITAVFRHGADLAALRDPLLALAATVLGRAALSWAQEVAAQHAAAAVKTELRGRLLAQVTRLGPGWLTGQRSGELTTLVTQGLDALDGYFARYLPQLVLAAVVPLLVLVFVLPVDPVAGITVAVTLPLIPVFMVLIGTTTQRRTERQYRLLARLSHHFLDVIAGLPTLKAFGRARAQADTIRRVTAEYRRVTMGALRLAFMSSLVLELISTISVALVAVGIGLRLVGGSMDLRTGLTVLILVPEAYLPLRRVGANFHASAAGLAAAGTVFAVLETPVPPAGTRTDLPDPRGATLLVDSVTVRYPDRSTPALNGASLRLEPGRVVALTGANGSGKSTLLAVLMGFVRPDSGRVVLVPRTGPAGTDSGASVAAASVSQSAADPGAWRSLFVWVPQRPHLFAASITDNIRLGDRSASDTAVRRAAEQAGAVGPGGFIDDLPDGFDTVLGDNGTGLSAGQRQRIALARAFLRDAPIVLLDEPTANLDAESEATVVAAVSRLAEGRTVLLVTHRPALLGLADELVTFGAPAPPADQPPGSTEHRSAVPGQPGAVAGHPPDAPRQPATASPGQRPTPSSGQPVTASSGQPTPSSGQPTPSSGQPTPSSGQPTPSSGQPVLVKPGAVP